MPYAKPNRTSTTPRPTPRRPRRPVDIAGPQNPTATIIAATGTWNFSCRIWIAFDPPTAATPTWIDISGFVETNNPITITHGRGDGLADVNATTVSLTVDNSDGRFSAANSAGAWFGQVHKGNWLKIEVYPPSGTVSSRCVCFITSLPNQWLGQYQFGVITASDRFERLGRARAIVSSIQSEVLTDPNLVGNVRGYWNLHEAQGSLTFGDTSGQGARYLQATGLGVPGNSGIGIGASNAAGPGFDGLRAITFNPVTSTQGTYLAAPITSPVGTWNYSTAGYAGLWPTLELWFQATTTGVTQVLACLADPTVSQSAATLYIDGATGCLNVAGISISQNNLWIDDISPVNAKRVDDGNWHHVTWTRVATINSGNFYFRTGIYLDGGLQGIPASGGFGPGNGTASSAYTQLLIGGGYDPVTPGPLRLGAANIAEVAFYGAPWDGIPFPNLPDHYAAGTTGFLGESTDARIARLARYSSVPIPLRTISTAVIGGGYTSQVYSPSQGAWTNLSPGAHFCGTQSVAGRKPLDPMQEAAHTENMPLYVDRSGYLAIQPSTARQNTSPAWSVNSLDLDPSTAVADDFAYTTNQMTISPNGLATQTVIGAPGSAGQLSQAKYDVADGSQSTASVNPIEAQSLGLGIIQLRADPAPRLAPLVMEAATLALLPGYGSAWYDAVLATEISTPARVTNAPAAVGGGNYDFLTEGWTETITGANHTFAFNTSPAQGPTYQLDDVVLGHIDTDGSTLAGSPLNTVSLTFQVATTTAGSPLWTTARADFPLDIRMDGEQITISGISGASSPQTFTASARSVNGVVASHPVGTAVSLWQPLTLAY